VRCQDDDPITDEEDSNSNKSDESSFEYLSLVGHQSLKSPVKQGKVASLMISLVVCFHLSLIK
jgi:hypothetical protein